MEINKIQLRMIRVSTVKSMRSNRRILGNSFKTQDQ